MGAGAGRRLERRQRSNARYPAREGQDRWRAVWHENGKRRQCEAISEERLAASLEKVTERLAADAPNMEPTGADLIAHYLDPDRLRADRRWSRKHAHTQRRLCERFATPVIGDVLSGLAAAGAILHIRADDDPAGQEIVSGITKAIPGARLWRFAFRDPVTPRYKEQDIDVLLRDLRLTGKLGGKSS